MLKNYLLVAWRNLVRKKSFSIINITGLSIGMASAIFILLWIQHEVSYDRFYKNQDRIYEAWNRYDQEGNVNCWNTTPKPMAAALKADFPEVERTARANYSFPMLLSLGDKRINARGTIVDSTFLQIFSFPVLKGNPATALHGIYSIVITENLAAKLFGDEDPMGKVVKLDNLDNFTVTGVVKNRPNNTRFDFEFLVPWSYLKLRGGDDENWANNSTTTYVMLKPGVNVDALQAKLKDLRKKYDKDDPKMETFVYPMSRTYLHSSFENGKESGGRIEIVRLFGVVAGFILLVACINFMNLSTARSEKRAREVGIRKVIGAQKRSLVLQFLGESVLISLIAGILALLMVQLLLPAFNSLVDKKLTIDFNSVQFWIWGLAFVLFTGILAGSYPALYLSSFRPVAVFKGSFRKINAVITPRKVLVVAQFSFAIVLIIATIIVRLQISNAQNRQPGYNRSNLVYHFMEGDVEKNYMLIKGELISSGTAISVTKTSSPITESWSSTWGIGWQGKDPSDKTTINRFCADDAFAKTARVQLVAGRDIDLRQFPTDSNAVLLNESAAKHMGFKEPLGQIIQDMGKDWHVVGVMKNFIVTSPYYPVSPMIVVGAKGFFNVIHFRLNDTRPVADNVAKLKAVFAKYNPEYPFNYRFTDEEYSRKFNAEQRAGTLATLFAILTIIISCLGLFGLASYMAENRIKEIGVRKVLGASVTNITRLLSIDFLKLVMVAFVIAAPLGYWAMSTWLQTFPYRITIQWWVLGLAGILALVIALITVSSQAIRAAIANPVRSLRSE